MTFLTLIILGQPSGLTLKWFGVRGAGSNLVNSPEILYALWPAFASHPRGGGELKGCGNGEQLQAQKEETLHLTQRRLKRACMIFLRRDSKQVTKVTSMSPKSHFESLWRSKSRFWVTCQSLQKEEQVSLFWFFE